LKAVCGEETMKVVHPCIALCMTLFLMLVVCRFAFSMPSSERQELMPMSDTGVGDSEIVSILASIRKRHDVPAMAAVLLTSQGIQKVAAIGTRKWGIDAPVTLDDLWHLGSDTKIMTSTIVAKLVEQGKLAWTSTVADVFPELSNGFAFESKGITVMELLSHVSGLPANIDYRVIDRSIPVRAQRIEVVKIALETKPITTPGTQYLYSNLGYIIVGAMIEQVLNMDWEAAMMQYVFIPLKLSSAGFGGLGTAGQTDQPWGHAHAKTPNVLNGPLADNPPVLGPAGGVHCTIQDWALFVMDQLQGARGQSALLQSESYQMLQTSHFGREYAMGWVLETRDWAGGKALMHAGSNTMYVALSWVAPAKDFAILVCTNEGLDSFTAADEAVGQIIRVAEKN
jgi:CubicO group peptidase (beta-lactamase class C family)